MREKEGQADYRFIPNPDLPILKITPADINKIIIPIIMLNPPASIPFLFFFIFNSDKDQIVENVDFISV